MVCEAVIVMLTPRTAVVIEIIKGCSVLGCSIIISVMEYLGLVTLDVIRSVLDNSILLNDRLRIVLGWSMRSDLVRFVLHIVFPLKGMRGIFDGEVGDFRYGFSLCIVLC